jgi:hypothetical protein
MARKTVWTDGQDTQVRRLRMEGQSWDAIAAILGLSRCTVIDRARVLGVEQPPANVAPELDEVERAPLPCGHAESWGVINRGTLLDGVPFKIPDPVR